MDTEILTPKSEVDDFQTPHDCQEAEIETENGNEIDNTSSSIQESNNESKDSTPSTSIETSGESLIDEKTNYEVIKIGDHNKKLEERLKELKEKMTTLKEQLVDEKVAWQKELEEAAKITRVVVSYTEQQLPADFKQESFGMELVPKCSSDIDAESLISEPTLSEFSILDYEQKLTTYQEALAKAQYEKRNMLKRQLAVNAYKRRLLEVEKLCSIELLKVKQSVQFLQPLQALACSWENPPENTTKFDDELTGVVSKAQNDSNTPQQNGDENIKSDFMTVEDLENTVFKDLKEFSSQIAATSSGFNLNDADEIMKTQLMANWYNNELGPPPFNPLM